MCRDGIDAPKCKRCGGYGKVRIEQCPQKLVSRETRDAFQMYDLSDKGLMPVAGGLLDQSASFVDSLSEIAVCERIASEK